MSSPLQLEDAALDRFAGAANLRGVEAPLQLPIGAIDAEATEVALSLVAIRDEQVLAERRLRFYVRLRIDSAVHLWSDEDDALTAALVLDPDTGRMDMQLRFAAAGKAATAAAADAHFLQAASMASRLVLRIPDHDRASHEVPFPAELRVEEGLVRFLDLLVEVAQLAGVDLSVPKHVDQQLINDLLVARSLLRGEQVRGKWTSGEITLEVAALPLIEQIRMEADRHQLMHVSELFLDIGDVQVPLGEVTQTLSDVVVEEVAVDEEKEAVILRVSAHGGSAVSVMTPSIGKPLPLEPHVVLPSAVFDELLADLDAPARASKLRELL
jgi:hypothetical protein